MSSSLCVCALKDSNASRGGPMSAFKQYSLKIPQRVESAIAWKKTLETLWFTILVNVTMSRNVPGYQNSAICTFKVL